MSGWTLHYTDGSPFARIVRVMLLEYAIPAQPAEMAFPLPPDFARTNPLGQIPVLEREGAALFPTSVIVEALAREAPEAELARDLGAGGWGPEDRQLLAVILGLGDFLAMHHYLGWAGMEATGPNRLGFDPKARAMQRALDTLDWLEARLGPEGFRPGRLAIEDVALACILLWTDSRGPIAWRGRPRLEALVARCAARPSFQSTEPRPWAPG